jgi:acetyl-CoA C-acetyltransferase
LLVLPRRERAGAILERARKRHLESREASGVKEVFIVAAARTPIGCFQGSLARVNAPRLGATAIGAAVARSGLDASRVEAAYLGCVLTSGLGQAPARQAAIYAGLSESTQATTVGKVCGSGLEAILLAARRIQLGESEVVVAGGMESMSNAPYLLTKARSGYRMGHGELVDAMIEDGLLDPYHRVHMGEAGEASASEHGLTREQQDAFARESYARALSAQRDGSFTRELAPVSVPSSRDAQEVSVDEEPGRVNLERMASLPGVFVKGGNITAANASKINDGAAALLLASGEVVAREKLTPLARIVAYAGHAQAPHDFTTAPVHASRRALERAALRSDEIDLFEINEAFAAVTMICARQLEVPLERVNVRGGAVALGHPIGATGARIVVTLLHAMADRGSRRGLASICIGGGEALALVVERCG